jgi:glucose-1-phosphate cytidylyltransferase
MKVAILAGGIGTRLVEETGFKPKPLVEIGARPILWHILKHYARYGFSDFVIALGYKGEQIKRYVVDYCTLQGDLTVSLKTGEVRRRGNSVPDWTFELIETGPDTLTGGRLKRLHPFLGDDAFMFTYGDGLSNVNLEKLLEFHRSHGKLATVTAVRPATRFGHMVLAGNCVGEFLEKPEDAEGWINGGFFVLDPGVFDYIDGDMTPWEREPMARLAADGELMAFRHLGYWQCMDTLRDRDTLQDLWDTGEAPWVTWE